MAAAMECQDTERLFGSENDTVYVWLKSVHDDYSPFHGYIGLIICVYGVLTNAVNIAVLTRKPMWSSVNTMLTGIAICDIGTMSSYLIYLCYFNIHQAIHDREKLTRPWMWFLLLHMNVSVVLHSASLWIAVAVAFIRKLIIQTKRPHSAWLEVSRAWRVNCYITMLTVLFNVPTVLTYKVSYVPASYVGASNALGSNNLTNASMQRSMTTPFYSVGFTTLALGDRCLLLRLVMWNQGILFKVIPCLLLTVLIFLLIGSLKRARRRRELLMNDGRQHRRRHTDRTTVLLVCILTVSLVTEVPQGLLTILSGIYVSDCMEVYGYVGDILDLLSLINSGINFVLYCTMNSKYRRTFWAVVLPAQVYRSIFHTDPSIDRSNTGVSAVLLNEAYYRRLSSANGVEPLRHEGMTLLPPSAPPEYGTRQDSLVSLPPGVTPTLYRASKCYASSDLNAF